MAISLTPPFRWARHDCDLDALTVAVGFRYLEILKYVVVDLSRERANPRSVCDGETEAGKGLGSQEETFFQDGLRASGKH